MPVGVQNLFSSSCFSPQSLRYAMSIVLLKISSACLLKTPSIFFFEISVHHGLIITVKIAMLIITTTLTNSHYRYCIFKII